MKDTLIRQLGKVEVQNMVEVEQLSSFVTLATEKREDMPASSLVRRTGRNIHYMIQYIFHCCREIYMWECRKSDDPVTFVNKVIETKT